MLEASQAATSRRRPYKLNTQASKRPGMMPLCLYLLDEVEGATSHPQDVLLIQIARHRPL
jgi:hypothetical protein